MSFENLNLSKTLLESVRREGYHEPTIIQQRAIPPILAGRDLLGCAQTGTGKTAAFALPLLQKIAGTENRGGTRVIRALILAPTRELALQINESFSSYGKMTGVRNTCIYGGIPQQKQEKSLKQGVDILIATPGRLIDLMDQRIISLSAIEYLVLDEADRMLDMGFIPDIRRILAKVPKERQTMLFSATITPEIRKLAGTLLISPVAVTVEPDATIAGLIRQSLYYVSKEDKRSLLRHVINQHSIENALVFTRTRHGADKVAKDLNKNGITADAIHGDKSQNRRESSLKGFKKGSIRVLVATDIASRGIDIDRLSHVINFEIPETPETYVHRIGRTGRAGSKGSALSFCSTEEKPYMKGIHKLINEEINVVKSHPFA